MVVHPFHPLLGQRVPILFTRRRAGIRIYVCEGGPLGSVTLPEDFTDRGLTLTLPEDFTDRGLTPAARPLTAEVLAELAATITALARK